MAWSACNSLHHIWISNLSNKIKINIFKTIIEPILLYGSETWTLSSKQHQRLDGAYTKLLMRIKNISWKSHPTIQQIYCHLPHVSQVIRSRRLQFAGHCFRVTKEVVSSFVLWMPKPNGRRSNKLSYPDVLSRDSQICQNEIGNAMQDRRTWKGVVKSVISTHVEE